MANGKECWILNSTKQPRIDFDFLGQVAGEDGLTRDPARLEAVSLDGLSPRAILRPATNEQAAGFLKYASEQKLKVAIRGGGTKTNLGNRIKGLDLVITTERLNRVLEYSPADLMVGIQAGANLQELQDQLEKNGQFLPVQSPLSSRATVGGAIAANTSGPNRLLYGPSRDWLIGVRFVLAEGLVAHAGGRVVKNVAGYDLMKLMIGSLGTLGLILDMNFKLLPLPKNNSTLICSFDNASNACEAALKIIDSGLFPNALTVLDSRACQSVGLKSSGVGFILLVEFKNTALAVERQVRQGSEIVRGRGSKKVENLDQPAAQKELWRKVTDFAYNLSGDKEKSFVLKAGILPGKSAPNIELAYRLAAKEKIELTTLTHAGHGILYLLGKYEDEGTALNFIEQLSRQVEGEMGSLVVEGASLSLKDRVKDVWGKALTAGEFNLMKGIKSRLDPENILNPGRFVGGI